jgi:acetyl-CoA carboxylase carboxyl transferase subunit beta
LSWPEKTSASLDASEKRSLGEGIFKKCLGCGATLTAVDLTANFEVCSACGYHHKMSVDGWRRLLLDRGLDAWDTTLVPGDPLAFDDGKPYPDRIAQAQKRAGSMESIEIGLGQMSGHDVAYGAFNFSFMGGSMGSVAGEKVTRLFEQATARRLPVLLLHASGGARMQEGILSLMQMAKAVSALERFRSVRKPFVSLLLNPTTGGVAASFAFLGDVNIAEPNALIGFAGPRVIESTLRQTLPRGFQRSEFLVNHGMVDLIVPRSEMKKTVSTLIRHLGGAERL